MTDYLYLDIETIPAQDGAAHEYLRKTAKAPANLKDPAKIESARQEAGEKAIDATSFDGWLGHVICISYAINDDNPTTWISPDEHDTIGPLFDLLNQYNRPVFVGHNIAAFDIPFITRRAVALGIQLPHAAAWPRDPKPWSDKIHDTMVMAAGVRDRISMDRLCFALGLTGKDGFDGSMVHDAWQRGERERIAEYCADDVRKAREIHRKFMRAGW